MGSTLRRNTVENSSKPLTDLSHRLLLNRPDPTRTDSEPGRDSRPRHLKTVEITDSVSHPEHFGPFLGQSVEEIGCAHLESLDNRFEGAERHFGTFDATHLGTDPPPGVRRETGPTIRIETVDRTDQPDSPRLNGIAQFLTPQTQQNRAHDHGPHSGNDELSTGLQVPLAGPARQGALFMGR